MPDVADFSWQRLDPITETSDALPRKGELWRLAWGDAHQLGVVIGTDTDLFAVLPVTLDPDDVADQWSVAVPGPSNPTDMPIAVLVQHRFSLPLRTFDARLGRLPDSVQEDVELGRARFRRGHETAGDVPAIRSILDPRLEAQEEMVDDFVVLTEAAWESQGETGEKSDLAQLHRVEAIEPDRVYDLINGAAPTVEEIALAHAEGVRLARPAYDRGLVAFLERPANSSRLRRLRRRSTEQVSFTLAADYLTERRYQTAARGADGDEWERLFQEFLDAQ